MLDAKGRYCVNPFMGNVRTGKPAETGGRLCCQHWGRRGEGVRASWEGSDPWSDETSQNSTEMVVPKHCECAKCLRTVQFKMVMLPRQAERPAALHPHPRRPGRPSTQDDETAKTHMCFLPRRGPLLWAAALPHAILRPSPPLSQWNRRPSSWPSQRRGS